ISPFMRHGADRVNVDQHAHTSYEQQPDGREWIEKETGIGMKWRRRAIFLDKIQMAGVGTKPGIKNFLVGFAGMVVRVAGVLPDRTAGQEKRQHHHANADCIDRLFLQLTAEKEHHGRAESRQQRNEPYVIEKEHASLLVVGR